MSAGHLEVRCITPTFPEDRLLAASSAYLLSACAVMPWSRCAHLYLPIVIVHQGHSMTPNYGPYFAKGRSRAAAKQITLAPNIMMRQGCCPHSEDAVGCVAQTGLSELRWSCQKRLREYQKRTESEGLKGLSWSRWSLPRHQKTGRIIKEITDCCNDRDHVSQIGMAPRQ